VALIGTVSTLTPCWNFFCRHWGGGSVQADDVAHNIAVAVEEVGALYTAQTSENDGVMFMSAVNPFVPTFGKRDFMNSHLVVNAHTNACTHL
jgi:hypothetical protein